MTVSEGGLLAVRHGVNTYFTTEDGSLAWSRGGQVVDEWGNNVDCLDAVLPTLTPVTSTAAPVTPLINTPLINTPFTWMGYTWNLHVTTTSQAWIDNATGYLWMQLNYTGTPGNLWPWLDLICTTPAHYGTYSITMATDVDALIRSGYPNFAFAMYICQDSYLPYRGELAIEPCQWGNANNNTMSWLNDNIDAAHPYGSTYIKNVAGTNVTHTLTWTPCFIKWEANGGTTGYVSQIETDYGVCPPDNGGFYCRLYMGDSENGGDAPVGGATNLQICLTNFSYIPWAPLNNGYQMKRANKELQRLRKEGTIE